MVNAKEEWDEPLSDGRYPFWNPHHKTGRRQDGSKGDVLQGTVEAIREGLNKFKKKQYRVDFIEAKASYYGKQLPGSCFTLVTSTAHERKVKKMAEGQKWRITYNGGKDVGQPNLMADLVFQPSTANTPF